jgi:hypothetical protein
MVSLNDDLRNRIGVEMKGVVVGVASVELF